MERGLERGMFSCCKFWTKLLYWQINPSNGNMSSISLSNLDIGCDFSPALNLYGYIQHWILGTASISFTCYRSNLTKNKLFSRNLPEVRSAHEILGVPTVSARFGTAPFFWNWGMLAMTNLLPPVSFNPRLFQYFMATSL